MSSRLWRLGFYGWSLGFNLWVIARIGQKIVEGRELTVLDKALLGVSVATFGLMSWIFLAQIAKPWWDGRHPFKLSVMRQPPEAKKYLVRLQVAVGTRIETADIRLVSREWHLGFPLRVSVEADSQRAKLKGITGARQKDGDPLLGSIPPQPGLSLTKASDVCFDGVASGGWLAPYSMPVWWELDIGGWLGHKCVLEFRAWAGGQGVGEARRTIEIDAPGVMGGDDE